MTFYSGENSFKFASTFVDQPHRGWYKDWYNTMDNLIRYMRFTGENMIIAGIYMYNRANGLMWYTKRDPNLLDFMARMLDANGMKLLLGVEYSDSWVNYDHYYSDRQVAAGASGLLPVSREGEQARNWCRTANCIAEPIRADLKQTVSELTALYAHTPGIAGLAFQVSPVFAPFLTHTVRGDNPLDWGYDDFTVAAFEKDTGVRVPVSAGAPGRFQRRHQWLMTNAQEAWIDWRNRKIFEITKELAAVITDANPKWRMFLFGTVFSGLAAIGPDEEKLPSVDEVMRRFAWDQTPYREHPSILSGLFYLRHIRAYCGSASGFLRSREWSDHPDVIRLCDEGAAFMHDGFFESTQRSKTWYFDLSLCGDFVCPAGRNHLAAYA